MKKKSSNMHIFNNLVWFWDTRKDPFTKGKPEWEAYDDIISTIIETRFQEFSD